MLFIFIVQKHVPTSWKTSTISGIIKS